MGWREPNLHGVPLLDADSHPKADQHSHTEADTYSQTYCYPHADPDHRLGERGPSISSNN